MTAYVRLQEEEFALEEHGYSATRHQREAGAGYFDAVRRRSAASKLHARARGLDGGRAISELIPDEELGGTKADEIALALEDAIISGELPPGTVLRQEQLSARFEVSRTPVREALRRLAATGLVSFVPNRGVRVRMISRDELRQAFLVRAELEALVTGLATPLMTAAGLGRLDAAGERFDELTDQLLDRSRSEAERTRLTADWVQRQLPLPRRDLRRRRRSARRADREERPADVPQPLDPRAARRSTTSTGRTSRSTARSATPSTPAARTGRGRSPTSTCSTRAGCSS